MVPYIVQLSLTDIVTLGNLLSFDTIEYCKFLGGCMGSMPLAFDNSILLLEPPPDLYSKDPELNSIIIVCTQSSCNG